MLGSKGRQKIGQPKICPTPRNIKQLAPGQLFVENVAFMHETRHRQTDWYA